MKTLVIYNPKAGHGRAGKLLPEIKKLFNENGIDAEFLFTEKKGHGISLVETADLAKYQAVVAAGGDGTLFETLNGLFLNKSDKKPPLGILPIGTGNAFVRDMSLDNGKYKKAIEIIAQGKTKRVDVGRFKSGNQRYYYINIVGLGFVSDVAELAHKLKFLGNLSYSIGVFAKLIPLKTFYAKIEFDGKTIERECIFIEVSNSTYTSNFLIAPNAKIDDGLLDITILNKTTRRRVVYAFPKIFKGEHIKLPEVETFKAEKISIFTEENKVLTPDGEILGTSPFEIECLKQAVEIFWRQG